MSDSEVNRENHLKYETITIINTIRMKRRTPRKTNLFFRIRSIIDFIFLSLLFRSCRIYTTLFLLLINFVVWPLN